MSELNRDEESHTHLCPMCGVTWVCHDDECEDLAEGLCERCREDE